MCTSTGYLTEIALPTVLLTFGLGSIPILYSVGRNIAIKFQGSARPLAATELDGEREIRAHGS
jgi:hypothetical protein